MSENIAICNIINIYKSIWPWETWEIKDAYLFQPSHLAATGSVYKRNASTLWIRFSLKKTKNVVYVQVSVQISQSFSVRRKDKRVQSGTKNMKEGDA